MKRSVQSQGRYGSSAAPANERKLLLHIRPAAVVAAQLVVGGFCFLPIRV